VILAGVSGSGKTTVGRLLADRLGWPFADGDSFHPAANVAKMTAGIPLTDDDRWPWLAAIGDWMDARIAAGGSGVVACSALKRRYRDVLRGGRPEVRLVFLDVSRDEDLARLRARSGHFFPARLMDSQFADLEPPGSAEGALVLAAGGSPDALVSEIISGLGLIAPGERAAEI
jgi:carbohydrate kinase (thermoresistant glucokinase family)